MCLDGGTERLRRALSHAAEGSKYVFNYYGNLKFKFMHRKLSEN